MFRKGKSKKELLNEIVDLKKQIKEFEKIQKRYKLIKQNLLEVAQNLDKRVSALKCLYGTVDFIKKESITPDEIIKENLQLLVPALKSDNKTEIKIEYEDRVFKTKNFKWEGECYKHNIEIDKKPVGRVIVCRTIEKSNDEKDIFSEEERELIDKLADQLGSTISYKKMEERLLELKKAVDTMRFGVTITDTNRKIIYSNPSEAKMHGYSQDELIGKDIRIFAPLHLQKQSSTEEIKKWTGKDRETINIRKDGSKFPIRLVSDIVRDPQGHAIAFITISENLTDIKQQQHAKKAIDITRLGVTITDLDRKILYTNPSDAHMHGYRSPNELIGKDVRIYSPPELRKHTSKNDIYKWKGRIHQSMNITKDGKRFPVRLISDIIKDINGKTIGIVTISESITKNNVKSYLSNFNRVNKR